MMKYLLTISFGFLCFCCVAQDLPEHQTYTFKKTGDDSLQLNVFLPGRTSRPAPVIVLFHGGGWVKGDRKQMNRQCAYFAGRGMVAITAEYRLLSSAKAPDVEQQFLRCIYDAKSAVRWVKKNAGMLGIDTSRMVLGGGSAGGYLATMAAFAHHTNDPADDTSISTRPLALVLFNPAYPADRPYVPDAVALADASAPPVIMFFGDQDEQWLPGGKNMHRTLLRKKVHSECWIAPGQTHSFFNRGEWVENTLLQSDHFLVALGLLPGGNVQKHTEMVPLEKTGN